MEPEEIKEDSPFPGYISLIYRIGNHEMELRRDGIGRIGLGCNDCGTLFYVDLGSLLSNLRISLEDCCKALDIEFQDESMRIPTEEH